MPQRLTWLLLPTPELGALSQEHLALAKEAWQGLLVNVGGSDPPDPQQLRQHLAAVDRTLASCGVLHPQPSLPQQLRLSALVDMLRQPGVDAARAATFVMDSQVFDCDCVCACL